MIEDLWGGDLKALLLFTFSKEIFAYNSEFYLDLCDFFSLFDFEEAKLYSLKLILLLLSIFPLSFDFLDSSELFDMILFWLELGGLLSYYLEGTS